MPGTDNKGVPVCSLYSVKGNKGGAGGVKEKKRGIPSLGLIRTTPELYSHPPFQAILPAMSCGTFQIYMYRST